MLSIVTRDCQVTNIVMNSGSLVRKSAGLAFATQIDQIKSNVNKSKTYQ